MFQFKLPDIGEGTYEADIIAWHVKVGDEVREDDSLVEVQSDKATADLPSPVSGIVSKVYGAAGDKALVGSVLIEIDTTGCVAAVGDAFPRAAAVRATQRVVGPEIDIRTLAVPRVRHFARAHGVDLRGITGTGRSGLITIADVEATLASAPAASSAAALAPVAAASLAAGRPAPLPASEPADTPTVAEANAAAPNPDPAAVSVPALAPELASVPVLGQERREKMTPIRRATATAMVQAKQLAPHVTVFDRAVVDALVAHRSRLKPRAEAAGVRLTYTPYLVKACVAMLKRHPKLNAYPDLAAGEIVYRDTLSVSVAVNTEQGLLVPVVTDADRRSLFDIAREIERLGALAAAGELTVPQMRGGSLTITNVGGAATAGVWSTPILNLPEPVIIGIGRIEGEFLPDAEKNPVYHEVMKISFGFDHRLIDGVSAQLALNDFKDFLSEPDYLFAEC